MIRSVIKTQYATCERTTEKELIQQKELFHKNNIFSKITDSISKLVVVLNMNRQIVYANKKFLGLLRTDDSNSVIGKRPGEADNCVV